MSTLVLPPTPAEQVAATPPTLWRRAPGRIFYAATGLGALLLLVAASYPLGNVGMFVLSFFWLVGCGCVWLARLIAYLTGVRSENRSGPFWPFLVAPIGAVLLLPVMGTDAPLQARWSISQGAFDARADQLVAQVESGRSEPGDNLIRDERVALYGVDFAQVDEDGNVFFVISGSGFIDWGGFARLPDGPPASMRDRLFEHLDGDWYTYSEVFD